MLLPTFLFYSRLFDNVAYEYRAHWDVWLASGTSYILLLLLDRQSHNNAPVINRRPILIQSGRVTESQPRKLVSTTAIVSQALDYTRLFVYLLSLESLWPDCIGFFSLQRYKEPPETVRHEHDEDEDADDDDNRGDGDIM